MAELQGLAWFPGIQQILSATFTLSHGITPSVCTVEILPQPSFVAQVGPLEWSFGNVGLVFPGCRLDQCSFRYNQQGLIWSLSILDRRWKWAFGEISGTYNERIPSMLVQGSIDAYTLKSPQELCILLLDAMGETGYDVSGVPNDARPEVAWDRDNPAQALAQLAEALGCRVVLRLDNTVQVARAGVGETLPDNFLMQDGLVFNPPERPDSLKVVGGKSKYQVDFLLEPVGRDVDGKWYPIADLSYKPAGVDWGEHCGVIPPFYPSVAGYTLDPTLPAAVGQQLKAQYRNPRELARETVFRAYRIKMQDIADSSTAADKPIIPGWKTVPGERIKELWQILPLENEQCEGWFDEDQVFHPFPIWVWGVCWGGAYGPGTTDWNSEPGSLVYVPFEVIPEEGILLFSQYLFKKKDASSRAVEAAVLACRVGVTVRDHDTRAPERYERSYFFSDNLTDTKPRLLRHEEIVFYSAPKYGNNHSITSLSNTQAYCDAEADYYLNAAALEYQTQVPQDRSYMGLLPISPDGAIQQVTWSVGPQGATTRASRGTEWNPAVPNYRERRMFERLFVVARTNPELLSRHRSPEGLR